MIIEYTDVSIKLNTHVITDDKWIYWCINKAQHIYDYWWL